MCRWIAYSGVAVQPEQFLFDEQFSLIVQSRRARKSDVTVNGDGFGFGWYDQEPTPGLFRDVLPAWSDENLRSLAHQIKPTAFMAHVRAATDTTTNRANCHPFCCDTMLFMHNGQIGGYPNLRRQLESRIEDRFYRYRQGSTDSELLFLLLIQYGAMSSFAQALTRVIFDVEGMMNEHKIGEPFRLSAALSDGQSLHVARYASDGHAPSVFYKHSTEGTIVVSEPLDDEADDWVTMPQSHTLSVTRGGEPVLSSLSN